MNVQIQIILPPYNLFNRGVELAMLYENIVAFNNSPFGNIACDHSGKVRPRELSAISV